MKDWETHFCDDSLGLTSSVSPLLSESISPMIIIACGISALWFVHIISQRSFGKRIVQMQVEVDKTMDKHSVKLALQDLDKAGSNISDVENLFTSINFHFECEDLRVQKKSQIPGGEEDICMCRYCHVVTEIRKKLDNLIIEKEEAWSLIKERAKAIITGCEDAGDVEIHLPQILKGFPELEDITDRYNKDRKACWESCFFLRKYLERCAEDCFEDCEEITVDTMKKHLEHAAASGLADSTLIDTAKTKIEENLIHSRQIIVQSTSSLLMPCDPCVRSSDNVISISDIKQGLKYQLPDMNGEMADLAAVMILQTHLSIMEGRRRDSYNEDQNARKEIKDQRIRQDELREKNKMKWELEKKRSRDRESRDRMKIEADRTTQLEVLRYKENLRLDHAAAIQRKERIRNDRDMLICFGFVVFLSAICNRFFPLHSVIDTIKTIVKPPDNSFSQRIVGLDFLGVFHATSHIISTILVCVYLAPFLLAVLVLSKIKDMSGFTQAVLLIIFFVLFFQQIQPILANSYVLVLIPIFAEISSCILALTYINLEKVSQTRPSYQVGLAYYCGNWCAYVAMAGLAVVLLDLLLCIEATFFGCFKASLYSTILAIEQLWSSSGGGSLVF